MRSPLTRRNVSPSVT